MPHSSIADPWLAGWDRGTFASSAVAVTADRKQYYSHYYYYKTRCVSGQELQNSLQENVIIMEREMRRFPWLTEYMWYLHQFQLQLQQLLLGIRCRTRKARRLSFKLTAQIFSSPERLSSIWKECESHPIRLSGSRRRRRRWWQRRR